MTSHEVRICGNCGHKVLNHTPKCGWPRCGCERARIRLTSREMEVLRIIAKCGSTKNSAFQLNISIKTIENHLAAVRKKLGQTNTTSAVLALVRAGKIPLDGLPACDLDVLNDSEG